MSEELREVFAKNLKLYMEKIGKTQADLMRHMKVSSATASDWVNGRKMPRADKLQAITTWLGIRLSDLMESHDKPDNIVIAIRIPVLGRIAAGIPISAVTEIIDWEEVRPEEVTGGEYFALQIRGDSMEPRIKNGDVVICRQQDDAEDGETVIAMVNGDDACCKKLKKYKDGSIGLLSTNPSYEPMIFTVDEIGQAPVRIIGLVKELRGKF